MKYDTLYGRQNPLRMTTTPTSLPFRTATTAVEAGEVTRVRLTQEEVV
jgi:hypothetical protein